MALEVVAELEAAFTDEKEAIVSQAEKTQATLEEERRAAEVCSRDPRTIRPDALASEALALMNRRERPVLCIFVADPAAGPAPVGIIHVHDCLRAGVDGGAGTEG